MRGILDTNPKRTVLWLVLINGLLQGLFVWPPGLSSSHHPIFVVLFSAVFGALMGLIGLYVVGTVTKWTGSWVGGVGSYLEIRAAIAWSLVPHIWGMILKPFEIFFCGVAGPLMVTEHGPEEFVLFSVASLFGAIELVLAVWIIVITIQCLAEAHRIHAFKAIIAWVLAIIIIGAIVGLLAVLGALVFDPIDTLLAPSLGVSSAAVGTP